MFARPEAVVGRLRKLKNFGRATSGGSDAYDEPRALNLKFTDVQAVIGLAQMGKLDGRVARMRAMWALYRRRLGGPLGAHLRLRDVPDDGWIPWFVDVEVLGDNPAATRDRLQAFLKAHRIGSRPMYPRLTSQRAFAASHPALFQATANASHPNAQRAADAVLFLPSSTTYGDGLLDLVCDVIELFFLAEKTPRAAR